jgi:GNAT superfamily N-acetyltransferase
VTLRRAQAPDAGALAELYLRARHAGARAGTIPPCVRTEAEIRQWMTDVVVPVRETWVAHTRTGALIGLLILKDEELDQLYVDPDHTGQGIGARFVDLAKRRRPHGLRLWTFVSNAGAHRFYERHGFVEARRTDGRDNEERAPDIEYVWTPSATLD